jgi:CheY-like chemotaxis protein
MQTITQDAIRKLHTSLPALANEKNGWRGLWIRLSNLDNKTRESALRQVQDILFLHLEDYHGRIYLCEDGDIMVMGLGIKKVVLDEVVQKLTYLLAADWEEEFSACCTVWDFSVHWVDLIKCVTHKLAFMLEKESAAEEARRKAKAEKGEVFSKVDIDAHAADVAEMALRRRTQRNDNVVMLVEDDTLSCKMIEGALRKIVDENCQIVTAKSGLQAYQSYAIHAPDIVFLDIGLPDLDGHALLDKLHCLDEDAFVVMLSGQSEKESVLQSMHLGARGFIGKPFSVEKLRHYIEQCPTFKLPILPSSQA